MGEQSGLDAAAIVGLLADPARRRAFAAIELGAGSIEAISTASGLDAAVAARTVGRLAESGLVVQLEGRLQVAGGLFQAAARAALSRPASTEHDDAAAGDRKVLNAFVKDGRLLSIPTAAAKRMVILDWLAQQFEPGRRYSEAMVNMILGQRHADTAALRRHLVDHDFLARADGQYWRSGGTVLPEPDAE